MKNLRTINYLFILFCFFSLLFQIIYDVIYKNKLLEINYELIIIYQHLFDYKFIYIINYLFSYFIIIILFLIIFYIILSEQKTEKGLFIFIIFGLGLYFEGTLKLFFLELRPLLIDKRNELKIYKNECNYGKPSGHSFLSVLSFLIFIEFNNLNIKGNLQYYLFGTCVFFILNSRFFLGAHSLDQIFMGLSLSILIFNLLILFRKKIKIYFIKPILKNNDKKKLGLIIYFILFFTLNLILIYMYVIDFNKEKKIINNNVYNNQCVSKYFHSHFKSFSSNHLFESITVNIIFGIFLGIYLNNGNFVLNAFKKNDFKNNLIRFFFFILGFLFYLLKIIEVKKTELFIIKYFWINFCCGFYLGFIYPKILVKLKLVDNKLENEFV